MVEIRGLTKTYSGRAALRNIDLRLVPGQVTAIVGPNGAGKSTLLKCVLGLVLPDSGTILVDGAITRDSWEYRRRIGYMPQAARFPAHLTAEELVSMVRELRGGEPVERETLVRMLGLDVAMKQPFVTLSGGTRQKVNALLALAFGPPIVILDEPTANLDPLVSTRIKEYAIALRERGRTVVVCSHHMAELEGLADRIVFMLDGSIRFDGTPAELAAETREPRLERSVARLMERSA